MSEVTRLDRPIEYRGFLIELAQLPKNKYEFSIKQCFALRLTGICKNQQEAIQEARKMIDGLVAPKITKGTP